jgi:large subunit ribosomal protein L5
MSNPMRQLMIEKVTMNIGIGEAGDKLEKAKTVLERITGEKVVKTASKHRIPSWGLRLGLPIGVKTTLRGEKATAMLKRLFKSVEDRVKPSQFDEEGNLSFGVKEYIHIPEARYDPSLGIFGLDISITLKRKGGFRTRRRAYRPASVGKSHRITKEEAVNFFKENFGIAVEEKAIRTYF